MTKVLRWDGQQYVDYDLPSGSVTIADDEEVITCCRCGHQIKFKDSFVSRQVHNSIGIGYAECEDCYRANNPDFKEVG